LFKLEEAMQQEWERGDYIISTDPARIDLAEVHRYLSQSYWAPGIPKEVIARSVAGSLTFGVYRGAEQVGFARVITDRATFAYLADVYVLEAHRGRGLARWLMEVIRGHPELQGLRRWLLATRDAHGLYAQFGFTPVARPHRDRTPSRCAWEWLSSHLSPRAPGGGRTRSVWLDDGRSPAALRCVADRSSCRPPRARAPVPAESSAAGW